MVVSLQMLPIPARASRLANMTHNFTLALQACGLNELSNKKGGLSVTGVVQHHSDWSITNLQQFLIGQRFQSKTDIYVRLPEVTTQFSEGKYLNCKDMDEVTACLPTHACLTVPVLSKR